MLILSQPGFATDKVPTLFVNSLGKTMKGNLISDTFIKKNVNLLNMVKAEVKVENSCLLIQNM